MPKAIIIAAAILGASYVLGNLHKSYPFNVGGSIPGLYIVNTVTGSARMCTVDSCDPTENPPRGNPIDPDDRLGLFPKKQEPQ